MEAGTVAPAAASTGSETIADIVGLAAERYGERPAAQRYKRDGEWHERLLRASSADDRLRDRPRPDRPRPRARRPRRAAVHDARRVDVRATSRSRAPAACVVPIYPTNSPERVRVGGRQLRVAFDRLRGRLAGRQDRRGPRPAARRCETSSSIDPSASRRRDLARRAARARPRAATRPSSPRAPRPSSPRTRTRSSTRPAPPARPRAACSRTATTARSRTCARRSA